MVTETLFRLTQNKDCLQKVRQEMSDVLKRKDFSTMTKQEWKETLTYEASQDFRYLGMCLNETLRLMPSIRISTQFCLNETVKLGGVTVPARQDMNILIYLVQVNPKEWIDPLKYVPERFDSESKWSLTPSGTKRHPMSFGPFLGGKRICMGKSFAESIGKLLISMIMS